MKTLQITSLLLLCGSFVFAQEKPGPPAAIDGVKGVKQEAVPSIKKVDPPTATAVSTPQGVNKVDGVNTVSGVKADGRDAVMAIPPPPPTGSAAQAVNKVDGVNTVNGVKADAPALVMPLPLPPPPAAAPVAPNTVQGVKATPPNAVQAVPPPPAAAAVISAIRAVQGVQGIDAPKQRNLEAALLIKEGGVPAGNAKAAAALLNGPPGPKLGPFGDGRAGFQEFEKLTAPGS